MRVAGRVALAFAIAIGIGVGLVAPRAARAEPAGDAVALLPLDADKSLEIYGQPVASEIARALVAGNIAVVVVGPRTAMPERARLIVDGTIALGKASAVTISIRIRNTVDGVVLETLSATAPGLARIDSAAAELSARVLPIVRDRLAAVRRAYEGARIEPKPAAAPPPPAVRPVRVAITDARKPTGGPLPVALDAAVASWSRAHRRTVDKVDAGKLAAPGADLAIGFWILDFTVDDLPDLKRMQAARARVRVQITSARSVVFDRIIVTDSVLGEPGLGETELAARVAREVLAILRPHLRRSVPSWP